MHLKELTIEGFKSFGKTTTLTFPARITGIVGPNGSGKSNVTEAFRFVLGEQSMKSMRGKRGEDLIFNGGTGTTRSRRAAVTIVFDNKDRILNDSFDQVAVSRAVNRDGSNEYTVNGTQVRHRDIIEMFSRANIGSTGHHIISQGESDRILNASPEERKEILEDGLGLKLLQYRRTEAQKKLNRARHNIAETDIVLREILPHLRNLKRQVERYEKARALRGELEAMYAEYLAIETNYIARTQRTLETTEDTLAREIEILEKKIAAEKGDTADTVADELAARIQSVQHNIQTTREEKDTATRELGRIEGEQEALTLITSAPSPDAMIERGKITDLRDEIADRARTTQPNEYPQFIAHIIERITALLNAEPDTDTPDTAENTTEMKNRAANLKEEQHKIQATLTQLDAKEKEHIRQQEALYKQQKERIDTLQQSEKELMTLMTEKSAVEQKLADTRYGLRVLKTDTTQLNREMEEGTVLIGDALQQYRETPTPPDTETEPREKQKERQRLLERKKIQLESIGTSVDAEVYKEYEEVTQRVNFLNKERDDLLASIQDCEECIARIQKEIDIRFYEGTKKISTEFEKFFKMLFNGGKASISIERKKIKKEEEEEEKEPEERVGVAVSVSLPRKKIHSLDQLSGGERALVSIALLFAISQVTPPPFLVLDETDAALDEANARRYAAMVKSLAEHSQIVLVTHNRETMHCADVLYGVTMNNIGISSLLSVRFEEAVQVAK